MTGIAYFALSVQNGLHHVAAEQFAHQSLIVMPNLLT
jgi:hypothetical protein